MKIRQSECPWTFKIVLDFPKFVDGWLTTCARLRPAAFASTHSDKQFSDQWFGIQANSFRPKTVFRFSGADTDLLPRGDWSHTLFDFSEITAKGYTTKIRILGNYVIPRKHQKMLKCLHFGRPRAPAEWQCVLRYWYCNKSCLAIKPFDISLMWTESSLTLIGGSPLITFSCFNGFNMPTMQCQNWTRNPKQQGTLCYPVKLPLNFPHTLL